MTYAPVPFTPTVLPAASRTPFTAALLRTVSPERNSEPSRVPSAEPSAKTSSNAAQAGTASAVASSKLRNRDTSFLHFIFLFSFHRSGSICFPVRVFKHFAGLLLAEPHDEVDRATHIVRRLVHPVGVLVQDAAPQAV